MDCLPSGRLPSGQGWTDDKISKICVCRKVTRATEENRARKGLRVLGDRGHFGLALGGSGRLAEKVSSDRRLELRWRGRDLLESRPQCASDLRDARGVAPDIPVVVCGESSEPRIKFRFRNINISSFGGVGQSHPKSGFWVPRRGTCVSVFYFYLYGQKSLQMEGRHDDRSGPVSSLK